MKRFAPLLFVLFVLGLAFLIVLAVIQGKKAHLDAGLFTDQPCAAPCWQNLTPGRSTLQDVDEFLQTLPMEDWPDRNSREPTPACKSIKYSQNILFEENLTEWFVLNVERGTLTFIQSMPDTKITLKQVVDHFGPPDYQKAILAIGPEDSFYILEVFYPKKGLAFKVRPNQRDKGQIKPGMPITTVQYFKPGDILTYLTVKNSCYLELKDAESNAQMDLSRYIRPWTGFGPVELIEAH